MAADDFPEDFESYAGTRFFIGTRPATNTETAFEGVSDWTEITITSVPNIQGRNYNTATLSTVSSSFDQESKGTFTLGSVDFGIQWLPDQAGQVRARAASRTYDKLAFAVAYQGGDVSYFSGQVMNMVESGGGGNDARAGTLTVLRKSDTIDAVTPAIPVEDTTP
jgi:hypothetical protein